MPMPPMKSLRGLSVLVVHPPNIEGQMLLDHLRRIGCRTEARWPIPKDLPAQTDVLFVSVDHDYREELGNLVKGMAGIPPTIVAIVDYENPSTLEILFGMGALAAMERPIRPFGVLTNLLLARGLWIERQQSNKLVSKLQRKLSSAQTIQKAKSILMGLHSVDEEEAYQSIRRQAMSRRSSMEEIASSIINANNLLQSSNKHG